MKEVIGLQGSPTMVPRQTLVKTINGTDHLLTDVEKLVLASVESGWRRDKGLRIAKILERASKPHYGTAEEQLEYAVENGWDALVSRNLLIKSNFKSA